MSEQEQTPRETLERWLLSDGIGIAMLGAPVEVREAIRAVLAALEQAQASYQFMVDRAANEKLDGYRELGARAASAENERDALRAAAERLRSDWTIEAEQYIARAERVEAALRAQARLLIKAGALRRGSSIGGQMMTGWNCGLCEREQVSSSTAHGMLCDDCRGELIARAALRDTAPEEKL